MQHAEESGPFKVSMNVHVQFHHTVSMAENMDAATQMVRSQIELFLNKARHEAQQHGIEMKCDYLVTYPC